MPRSEAQPNARLSRQAAQGSADNGRIVSTQSDFEQASEACQTTIDGIRASNRSEQSSRDASPHEKTFEFFIVSKRDIGPTVASSHCSRPSP